MQPAWPLLASASSPAVGAQPAIASDGNAAYTWGPSGAALIASGAPGGGAGGELALTDSHGDQVGQFAAAATSLTASRSYDPWGDVTATTGTPAGQLGYQCAWGDAPTGKDLMGARWYNPAAGGVTNSDTIQVSPVPDPAVGNPTAYVGDDPLDYADPTGHWAIPAIGDPLAPLSRPPRIQQQIANLIESSARRADGALPSRGGVAEWACTWPITYALWLVIRVSQNSWVFVIRYGHLAFY